jgi:hypothetical protein
MRAAGGGLAFIGSGLFIVGAALLPVLDVVAVVLGFEAAGEPWIRVR